MSGPTSWRRYADKPIKLGEPPAFETALELPAGVMTGCEGCCKPINAFFIVAGKQLCSDCALKGWEG